MRNKQVNTQTQTNLLHMADKCDASCFWGWGQGGGGAQSEDLGHSARSLQDLGAERPAQRGCSQHFFLEAQAPVPTVLPLVM